MSMTRGRVLPICEPTEAFRFLRGAAFVINAILQVADHKMHKIRGGFD